MKKISEASIARIRSHGLHDAHLNANTGKRERNKKTGALQLKVTRGVARIFQRGVGEGGHTMSHPGHLHAWSTADVRS